MSVHSIRAAPFPRGLSLFSPWEAVYAVAQWCSHCRWQLTCMRVFLLLGVPHDRSLDEALYVVGAEGLGAGARGAVLGSVDHALG